MSKALTPQELDAAKRKILFVPCKTKDQLHKWIKVFLHLDLPDCIVDKNSNSSPMDMVYESYSKMLNNDDENFSRVLYYASRGGGKTISQSVLEVLCLYHLERDVCHLAAIEAQSKKAQEYVKGFLNLPYLRDYIIGDNSRECIVRKYRDKDGDILSPSEFERLTPAERNLYTEVTNYIRIIVATVQSTNGQHPSVLCCVDRKTEIQCRFDNGGNRKRQTKTALGIFRRLQGLEHSGRPDSYRDNCEAVVEEPKQLVEVMSLNQNTGAWEFAPIVRAVRSKRPVLKLKTNSGIELRCTYDHPILTANGFVQAKDLKPDSLLITVGKTHSFRGSIEDFIVKERNSAPYMPAVDDHEDWGQVVLGSLLGDAGIYKPSKNPYLREQHAPEQAQYLAWKRSIVQSKVKTSDAKGCTSGYTGRALVGYYTCNSELLMPFVNVRTRLEGIEKLNPLGLSVWYSDDGCAGNGFRISTEGFTKSQNQQLCDFLNRKFQITASVSKYEREGKTYYYVVGDVEAKRRLVELCAPYVHPEMAYKFDVSENQDICKFCGNVFWFYETSGTAITCGSTVCRMLVTKSLGQDAVVSIEDDGEDWVYDFVLKEHHNFVSNRLISHNCDEVEIIKDPAAYEEAKMVPAQRDGKNAFTVLTSSRKYSFGLVQKEIDEAAKTGLHIRHFNIIDTTRACPPERHWPDDPKISLYVNDVNLKTIPEEEYTALSEEEKTKFVKEEMFAGCKVCPIAAACKGRLATEQKSTSPVLKPIHEVIAQFRTVSLPVAMAQLLCRKPSTEGLVYPMLNREVHLITAAKMAEMVTGDPYDPKMTKAQLIALFQELSMPAKAGMDFGYSHNFAVTSGFVFGSNAFVIDVIAEPELDPSQQLVVCKNRIMAWKPDIYGDPENPQMIKVFRKAGFRMRDWKKGPGSVMAGIDAIRMKLSPAVGDPQLYFLQGDEGIEMLFRQLERYHFLTDAAGRLTDQPDEKDDDSADALRMMIMNVFAHKGKPLAPRENVQAQPQQNVRNWAQKIIDEAHGNDPNDEGNKGRAGNFKWTL